MDLAGNSGAEFDPGSFRDPLSRVFRRGNEVGRVFSPAGEDDWRAFANTPLFERWTSDGRLIGTVQTSGVDGRLELRHDLVPFWSYPYEWSFSMLRAAARLQLELQAEALEYDMTVKDATPYNIQFVEAKPIFIDAGSFRPLEKGEPWLGYRQFCEMFLFPLLVRSHARTSFQPLLRASLSGIPPSTARALLRGTKVWKPGVLADVVLQARADRAASIRNVRSDLKDAGFSKEMIQNNLRRLIKVVESTTWDPEPSTWSEYSQCEHVSGQRDQKTDFVRQVASEKHRTLAWDLGANDGHFSRIVAAHVDTVVAIDSDELVVDQMYKNLVATGTGGILPLVVDLSDPSPALGWRGAERKPLHHRGSPDLTLMLAIVHHLVIASNIPLGEIIDWMASLDSEFVFEWVPPTDPMVRELMVNKKDREVHPDYREDFLRERLADHFEIEREAKAGNRLLLHLCPLS